MRIAVRYFTRSGNTAKLAKAIAETVKTDFLDVSIPLKEKADILFLGSSVYAAGIDDAVKKFIEQNSENIGMIVNFSTAALLSSTYRQVKRTAEANGIKMAVEEFHCKGAFAFMHKGKPNNADLEKASAFANDILSKYKES